MLNSRRATDLAPAPCACPNRSLPVGARKLIESCRYLRRKEELEDAEGAIK